MNILREYSPRRLNDAIPMAVTFIGIPFAFQHGFFYVTPRLYPLIDEQSEEERFYNRSMRILHYCFMTYLLVIVMADLFLTLLVEPSCTKKKSSQLLQPGWVHCPYCKQYVPPRTYHCLTCRKCVYRRDHHCFFVGRCIGYQNHKHFMLFAFHTFVAALYASVLSMKLVFHLYNGFSWEVLVAAIFPVIAVTLELVEITPVVLICTSLAVIFMILTGGLLAINLLHLYKGQTFWEATHNIPQPKGFVRNARDLLGANWWIVWVCPFIPSPLPGDGKHYLPAECGENGRVITEIEPRRKRD